MARSVKAKPAAGPNPRRHLSPETRARIAAALKGHEVSPETRAKLAAAKRGHEVSPETRAKLAAALRGRPGRPRSPETRAKLSAPLARIAGEEFLDRQRKADTK